MADWNVDAIVIVVRVLYHAAVIVCKSSKTVDFCFSSLLGVNAP